MEAARDGAGMGQWMRAGMGQGDADRDLSTGGRHEWGSGSGQGFEHWGWAGMRTVARAAQSVPG